MAGKWHINEKGEVSKCTAIKGKCPFGNEDSHYPTKESAYEAFQHKMEQSTINETNKKDLKHYCKNDEEYERIKNKKFSMSGGRG